MPNLDAWVGTADRATSIANLIALKPTSITIVRAGSILSAQTVRLETLASQRQVAGQGGVIYMVDAMLLGYKNHPTIADTDVKAGDRFVADGTMYEVIAPMPAHEECLQCYLRVKM